MDRVIESESEEDRERRLMRVALGFAEKALERGEVPVGCLFVYNDEIIANGSNAVNETKNATRHAEMNCVDTVIGWSKDRGLDHRVVLNSVDVVVTVEPCIMCAAALQQLQVRRVTYGCANSRFGGCGTVLDTAAIYPTSSCRVQGGVFAEEVIALLKKFYAGTNPNAPICKVKTKNKRN